MAVDEQRALGFGVEKYVGLRGESGLAAIFQCVRQFKMTLTGASLAEGHVLRFLIFNTIMSHCPIQVRTFKIHLVSTVELLLLFWWHLFNWHGRSLAAES